MKKETFQNDLAHIYAAYRFCASCIPNDELFLNGQSVRVGKTLFEKKSQALSMRVELGWAFFTRMDACLETLAHELNIQSGGTRTLQYLEDNGCTLSDHEKQGLSVYREIRNALHHGDGNPEYLKNHPKTLIVNNGIEPHLFEEQMNMFYDLFKKVGEFLTKPSTTTK
jgi:hypothetical protein